MALSTFPCAYGDLSVRIIRLPGLHLSPGHELGIAVARASRVTAAELASDRRPFPLTLPRVAPWVEGTVSEGQTFHPAPTLRRRKVGAQRLQDQQQAGGRTYTALTSAGLVGVPLGKERTALRFWGANVTSGGPWSPPEALLGNHYFFLSVNGETEARAVRHGAHSPGLHPQGPVPSEDGWAGVEHKNSGAVPWRS